MRAPAEIEWIVEAEMAKHESVRITTSEPPHFAALQDTVDNLKPHDPARESAR